MDSEDRLKKGKHSTSKTTEDIPTGISSSLTRHEFLTKKSLQRLYINIGVTGTFMLAELIGGIISDSIAVISDSFHMFTDILGFVIIIISLHLTKRKATLNLTFGYHRAEVIGTLLSMALIWGLAAWLITEAIDRLISPQDVDGLIMLITACGGLAANILMGFILLYANPETVEEEMKSETENDRDDSPEAENKEVSKKGMSLNIKAAFIHVLGDGLQSVGVIIAGIIVYVRPDYTQADPVCTLMFVVAVLGTTLPVLGDCIKILMEASPGEINMKDMIAEIKEIEDVIDIHDLHVWSLSSGKVSLSCHLISDNPSSALDKATRMVKEKYHVNHVTIQIETGDNSEEFVCENDLF